MSQTNVHSWLDGRLQYNHVDKGTSLSETVGYHKNRQVWFRYPLFEGQFHGLCRTWYDNGQLRSEENYERGDITGIKREWYSTGRIKCMAKYFRGFLDGITTYWDEDGKISRKQVYARGAPIGGRINAILVSGKLTAKDVMETKNSAVRRICLEELGYERFLSQVGGTVIDRDGHQELIQVQWHKSEEPICLVKVKCASLGVFYTLRVPPGVKTVKEAVAWTFDIKPGDYSPQMET